MKTIGKYLIGAYVSLSIFALLLPEPYRVAVEIFISVGIVTINMIDNKVRRLDEVVFLKERPSIDTWEKAFGESPQYRKLKEIKDLNTAFFATAFLWFYMTSFSVVKYFAKDTWLTLSSFIVLIFITIPIPIQSFENYLNSYRHSLTSGVKVNPSGKGISLHRREWNKFSEEFDDVETYSVGVFIEGIEYRLKGNKRYLKSINLEDELYLCEEKSGRLRLVKLDFTEEVEADQLEIR